MGLEESLQELYRADHSLEIYRNPFVQFTIEIIKTIPGLSAFITVSAQQFNEALMMRQADKLKTVLDEVLKGDRTITQEMLSSIETVEAFRHMLMAVDRTNVNEKIQLFARLFRNCYILERQTNDDVFEAHLYSIENLSYKEIYFLCIFFECENETNNPHQNEYQNADAALTKLKEKFAEENKSYDEYKYLFSALVRTGFMREITASIFDYRGHMYTTTSAMQKFHELVKDIEC